MLVFADGSQRNTLGGGCIEAEVKQRALRVLAEKGKEPEVLSFCLDDNYGWDDGLICGGHMSVLAVPFSTEAAPAVLNYYRRFHDLVESGQGCTEAVAIGPDSSLPVGRRFLFDFQGQLAAQANDEPLPQALCYNLPLLKSRPRPSVRQGVAYLPVLPRMTLLIVGGGHVGQAVARLAAEVDFDVWVLDDRATFANRERFPTARRWLVGDIGETLRQLVRDQIDPSTYGLIVTRGHNHDEEALEMLAATSAGYVGMIGSKRKVRLIYEDLLARGIPKEVLARVHAPVGLDIGSQTVPEIAISIVAELIACRNLGQAPTLRDLQVAS